MQFSRAWIAVCGLLLTAAVPPPRESGLDIPTAQSIPVLSQCIDKKLGPSTHLTLLENGGVTIDWGAQTSGIFHTLPTLYLDLIKDGQESHIIVRYRHPMSKGTAAKILRMVGRKCFAYELEAAGGGRLP